MVFTGQLSRDTMELQSVLLLWRRPRAEVPSFSDAVLDTAEPWLDVSARTSGRKALIARPLAGGNLPVGFFLSRGKLTCQS